MRAVMTILPILLLSSASADVWSQQPHVLSAGEQVKLYPRGIERSMWDWHRPHATGTVLALTRDSVTLLTTNGSTVVVPLNSVGSVVVNRGPQSNWRRGMIAGVVIGAGAGLVAGLTARFDVEGCHTGFVLEPTRDCQDAWLPVLGMMGLGALGGGLLGVVVGSLVKTDTWEEVSLERRPMSFIAQSGRIGLAASVSF